jgi:predicted MFS family arabinose efflux permease
MDENRGGLLAAFASRSYRLLWGGAFLSSIGTWTQDVAMAWFIHTKWGNPAYLGLRAFAADAPLVAFMLVGGAMADRVDRRRILLSSQFFQMSLAAVLGTLYVLGRLDLGPILAIAFLTGLAQSQSAPTYQAVLTSVVPPHHIPQAVALNSLQFNLSRTLGPVLAGLLLVRGGTGTCFFVNVVSFLAVIVALMRIEIPGPVAPPRQESLGESLRSGIRYVAGHPLLARLTLLGALGSLLAFPLITFLPVVASDVLHADAGGYSLLLSSFGLGAIAGALATARRGNVRGRGRTLLLAFMIHGAATLGVVYSHVLPLSVALLLVGGASLVTAFSTLNSLVQENADAVFKGRILGIYGVAFRGGLPVGSLIAGVVIKHTSVVAVLATFAALLIVLTGAFYTRSQALREL